MILVQNHQQRLNGNKNSIEYTVLSIELRKERKRNIELSPNLLGLVSHLFLYFASCYFILINELENWVIGELIYR
jgi:hypothetical protein